MFSTSIDSSSCIIALEGWKMMSRDVLLTSVDTSLELHRHLLPSPMWATSACMLKPCTEHALIWDPFPLPFHYAG